MARRKLSVWAGGRLRLRADSGHDRASVKCDKDCETVAFNIWNGRNGEIVFLEFNDAKRRS